MLALCLVLQGAAQSTPLNLQVVGEGRTIRLVDPGGGALNTEEALQILGRDDLAMQYHRHRGLMRGTAIALWSAGGVLFLAGGSLDSTAPFTAREPLSLGAMGVGLAAVGGGFAVFYADPKRPLGAWMDPMEVELALAQRQQNLPQLLAQQDAFSTTARDAGMLWVDQDGILRQGNRRLSADAAARLFHDEVTLEEYRRTRSQDKVLWGTTLGVGGAATAGGFVAIVTGVLVSITGSIGNDSSVERSGLLLISGGAVAITLGSGGIAAGTTGLIVTTIKHNRPSHYYSPEELQEKVNSYNQNGPLPPGTMPLPEATFRVMPLLGPGIIGVQGVF